MAKFVYKSNPAVSKLFDELDSFKEFCADYGYVYDESKLGDMDNFSYRQFTKYHSGKGARDMWMEDLAALSK